MSYEKLSLIREQIVTRNLDGYIIPSNDEFFNEYTPEYNKRLKYITNFTGSNGILLILINRAILFTDGRYIAQAKIEIDNLSYQIIDTGKENLNLWIKNNLNKNFNIGFDSKLHNENFVISLKNYCNMVDVTNLVDTIWYNKPIKAKSIITDHPIIYTGQTKENKLLKIKNNDVDVLIITNPASICWLLNIRGEDVPFTPIILSYLMIFKNNDPLLFTDSKDQLNNVEIVHIDRISNYLKLKGKKVQIDKSSANYYLIDQLNNAKAIIVDLPDPCLLPKACKNSVEINNAKIAHIKDSIAMCKFLFWFFNNNQTQTELSLINKLENFRKQDQDYISASFETICGYKSNAAIIHYKANELTNKTIEEDGLILIDSGAQYKYGTTDVTRTISLKNISDQEKNNFTRVLKGHIALVTTKYPKGTCGFQLDSIARYYLWQNGLDYAHGTGHGVGSYLSVHEGPQRISKYPNDTVLLPGMILSNEPGYYEEGKYGIRIENLIYVIESEYSDFLEFRNLTFVPIDYNLVNQNLLNNDEKRYLINYHKDILEILSKQIEDINVIKWLEDYVDTYQKFLK